MVKNISGVKHFPLRFSCACLHSQLTTYRHHAAQTHSIMILLEKFHLFPLFAYDLKLIYEFFEKGHTPNAGNSVQARIV